MADGGYKKELDKVIAKFFSKVEKRYINCTVYSYNNGPVKLRIQPSNKNTNPDAGTNKQWVNQPGISGITKEEAEKLIYALQGCVKAMG